MRFLFILFFFPLFVFGQSKEHALQGLWVRCKSEMKDGSRIVDHNGTGQGFLKYNFNQDGFLEESDDILFKLTKLPYMLTDGDLVIGNTKYIVDKLTEDSLRIYEKVDGLDDSKIKMYSFVKVQNIKNTDKSTFNSVIMDSVYQATPYLFPQCTDLMSILFTKLSGYNSGSLKIKFIVNKDGKVKDVEVLENHDIQNKFEKSIVKAFESSSIPWVPALKNNVAVNTSIELIFTCNHAFLDGIMIKYPFLPSIVVYGKKLSMKETQDESNYFNKGINEIKSQEYTKAIDFFTKCISIDEIDLDAYYLRAFSNLRLSNKDKACSDYTILVNLGQVPAAKNMKKICLN